MDEKLHIFENESIQAITKHSDGWSHIALGDNFNIGTGDAEKVHLLLSEGNSFAYRIDSLAGQPIIVTDEPINSLLGHLHLKGFIDSDELGESFKTIGVPRHAANIRQRQNDSSIPR